MRLRRRALLLAALSFTFWTVWYLRAARRWDDAGDLQGGYSDHFTHLSATRVLPSVGLDLWRRPFDQIVGRATELKKPAPATWAFLPRLYPVGSNALLAPLAWVYDNTRVSFRAMNRMLIVLFLFYAHIGLWFAFEHVHQVGFIPLAFLYSEVVFHTLNGFYDAATLAPLVLGARYLAQRRGLAALVAFAVAGAIHFRAIYFLPWAAWALWLAVRSPSPRPGLRTVAAWTAIAICALACLIPFAITFSTMKAMDQTNPVFIGQWKGFFANRFALLSALAGLGAVLVWCRAWADLVLLAWVTVLVLRMPFVQGWYGVVLAAWLAAPIGVLEPRRAVHVSYVRVIAWLAIGMVVFGDQTLWRWLATLFR